MVWKKGESGNPAGKPKGLRNKLTKQTEALFAAATSGPKAKASLEKLRTDNPAAFWTAVTRLLPKQVEADVTVDGDIVLRWLK